MYDQNRIRNMSIRKTAQVEPGQAETSEHGERSDSGNEIGFSCQIKAWIIYILWILEM